VPRLRELPRAGLAVGWGDLRAAWRRRDRAAAELPAAFSRWLGVEGARVASSGRAALCLTLRALADGSARRRVIVPAYTCPTVPLAVARAGLEVELCDVDPASANLDPELLGECLGPQTLAVVAVHMNGIPCELDAILARAREAGAAVIEDCAAAAGATLHGRPVGSFGDAAFFSLARGKGFTAYAGGVGVGRIWKEGAEGEVAPGAELLTLARLLALVLFFHPRRYWALRRLPLGWENEVYAPGFPLGGMGALRQGVALSVLERLDRVVAERRERARYLERRLRGLAGVCLLVPPPDSDPCWPWLPLLVGRRDEAVRRLRAEGLGASPLFTRSLDDYEYLRGVVPAGSYPVARSLAGRLMSLPTHCHVTARDLDRMVDALGALEHTKA